MMGGLQAAAAAGFARGLDAIASALPELASMLSPVAHAETAVSVGGGAALPIATPENSAGITDTLRTATPDAVSVPWTGPAHRAPHHQGPAPGGAPSVSLVPPTEFAERLTRALVDSHQAGRPLHVRLHPPELGVLQIELSDRGGGLTARLDVETTAARQAILEQLPQLRDALTHAGHQIERIDVYLSESAEGRPQHNNGRHPHGRFGDPGSQQQSEDAGRQRDETGDNEQPGPPHVRLATRAVIDGFDIQV
jgi:flagellar hook-length control protein FliK